MSVALSPDAHRVVTGSTDQSAKLWDVGSDFGTDNVARELLTLKGHADVIDCVAFSPDAQRIATGSRDRTVKIWEQPCLNRSPPGAMWKLRGAGLALRREPA